MSVAFQCDFCKKCFTPYEVADPDEFLTIKEVYAQNWLNYDSQQVKYREETLHVCKECTVALKEFIEGRKRQNEVKTIVDDDVYSSDAAYVAAHCSREIGKFADLFSSYGPSQAFKRESGTETESECGGPL